MFFVFIPFSYFLKYFSRRVRFNPTAPSFQALTDTAQQPDPEPPLPCPVDSDPQQLFIDSVTDGGVYQNAEADLPSSTQAQIISFIEVCLGGFVVGLFNSSNVFSLSFFKRMKSSQ